MQNNAKHEEFTINLDMTKMADTYNGFCGQSAGTAHRLLVEYPKEQRDEILDLMFKPGYGASMDILRIEIGADIISAWGTEPSPMRTREEYDKAYDVLVNGNGDPALCKEVREMFLRGYGFWLAIEAKKRNPEIMLDCMLVGAPGWVSAATGNIYSQDTANYLALFLLGAKMIWKLDINFVPGMQNETDNADPEYIKLLRRTLDGFGLRKVGINVCDTSWPKANDAFNSAILTDTELQNAVRNYGNHYISLQDPVMVANLPAAQWAKSKNAYWNGEDNAQPFENAWGRLVPFKLARRNAWLFNDNYVRYRMTGMVFCFPICSWLPAVDNQVYRCGFVNAYEPWSGHYDISPSCWAAAHTTQFADVGYRYLQAEEGGGSGCLPQGGKYGTYVTLVNPDTGDYSIVLETGEATGEQTVTFTLGDGFNLDGKHVWESYGETADTWFVNDDSRLDRVSADGKNFSITLKPDSVVTITSTGRGQKGGSDKVIPGSELFPAAYFNDFVPLVVETTPELAPYEWSIPSYLSSYAGAFEIVDEVDELDENAGGKCLEQKITEPLWAWFFNDSVKYRPMAVVGDPNWDSYRITVDAKLPDVATAEDFLGIGGYFDSFSYPSKRFPVMFTMQKDGSWNLYGNTASVSWSILPGTDKVVANGKISGFDGTKWHEYKMELMGTDVKVYMDNAELASGTVKRYGGGMFINCSWVKARFDNLRVERLESPPWPPVVSVPNQWTYEPGGNGWTDWPDAAQHTAVDNNMRIFTSGGLNDIKEIISKDNLNIIADVHKYFYIKLKNATGAEQRLELYFIGIGGSYKSATVPATQEWQEIVMEMENSNDSGAGMSYMKSSSEDKLLRQIQLNFVTSTACASSYFEVAAMALLEKNPTIFTA